MVNSILYKQTVVLGYSLRDFILIVLALLLGSVFIGYIVGKLGLVYGILINVLLIGIPTVAYMMRDIKFGVLVLLAFGFLFSEISNFYVGDFPLGVVVDVMLLMLLLSMIVRRASRNDYSVAKNPISILVWLWLIYAVLEIFNPLQSREAWIYSVRSTAGYMVFFFIALEALDDSRFFKHLIFVWIGFALIGALYGLKQEFFGLSIREKAWVMGDEERFGLFFNWGKFRVFSFFNDPTVFGILMSFSSLFCFLLLGGPGKWIYKFSLFGCGLVMLLAAVYSGTRTAYAMLPAGFGFFSLLTFNWRAILVTLFLFMIGGYIVFSDIQRVGPFINTNSLERIRSAFKPSEDPSYLLRQKNQAAIRPFLHGHPFGAGIGSAGASGEKLNPHSPVAGFAPDSMYVKIAVEMGWVGLLLYCILLTSVLIIGVRNYFRIKNPELKVYAGATVAVIYSMCIANYPQMATLQIPNVFIFYALAAAIVKLPELDKKSYLNKP